jgi:phospholipid transport system substrate-binding protein
LSAVLFGLLFVVGALLDAGHDAQAQALAPDLLMKSVTSDVIAVLRENRGASQPTKVAELVEAKVLPLFDFPRMTSIAVALNWRNASAAQQNALTAEFRTLLVRTYSVALSNYRDQRIDYLPLRASSGDTEVTVRSMVRQPGAEPLSIDYEMEQTPSGWQVYDIKIAGVSMVISYRATFAAQIRETGVDGLIKSLSDKNGQNPSGVR